ncbi:unnamed protein product [Didymodactylos carnosus]|uniref:Right handed beta helix domain-containing protein n=1 Tax=Didymodactylos carnosus TaxID=1234261 RepID=A0A815K6W8_9BILA|nr:unnamed protein product [Didymodactylos carnosus]CAF4283651.1 unnamed protein product [Didymodactylos carnosus]
MVINRFQFLRVVFLLVLCAGVSLINVKGPVFHNVTWKQSNNPYNVVGDFQIPIGVTLTIKAGTRVVFNMDFRLLIVGKLKIEGSLKNPVKFFGNVTNGGPMIVFQSTNLSESSISYCNFYGPKPALQINQGDPATGTLNANFIFINNSAISNYYGGQSSIAISVNNSVLLQSDVTRGLILITNSDITSSTIDQNAICNLTNCKIKSSTISNGYSGFNEASTVIWKSILTQCTVNVQQNTIVIEESNLTDVFVGGDGAFILRKSSANGLTISFAWSHVELTSCKIINKKNETMVMGWVNVSCCDIQGNKQNTGIIVNGLLFNLDDTQTIVNSSFYNFAIGIQVSASEGPITIANNNLYQNSKYNLYNKYGYNIVATNNWWGTSNPNKIKKKIYDYYEDILTGKVLFNPFLQNKNPNVKCLQ